MKARFGKHNRPPREGQRDHRARGAGGGGISPQSGQRILVGRNAARELLLAAPQRIITLYIAESPGHSTDPVRREILALAETKGIDLQYLPESSITKSAGMDSHQGFALLVKERHSPDLSEFIESQEGRDRSLVLMLDNINDPQNFGALLRAAECYGVNAVIWSKNRGTDITPVVSKVSVGASELVTLVRVSNLHDSLLKLKDAGYWGVAAAVDDTAQSLRTLDFPGRTVLVMGSEGEGIQPILLKKCDFRAYIPMVGRIDSLNVSQATAVFLEGYRRCHMEA